MSLLQFIALAKDSSTKFVSGKTGRVFEKHPCLQCEKVFSSGRGVQMHLLQCKVSTEQVAQPPTNVADSVVVGKKRGRPSKAGKLGTFRMAVAVGEVPAGQSGAVDSMEQAGGKGETTSGLVKKTKRRGRPPKTRKVDTVEDQQAVYEGETSGDTIVGKEMEGQGVEEKSWDSVSALPGGGKGRGRGRPAKKGKDGVGELTKKGGRKL